MATTTPTPTPTGDRSAPPASVGRIALFGVAVLALGWLGPLVDRLAGQDTGAGPGQLVWLLLPVGVATLLRWRGGDGFADAGLQPNYRANRRWYDLSSAFYPVVMLLATAGGLLAGHWELYDDAAPIRFAVVAAIGLIPFTLTAIAEEFGWRGYLTPRLEAAGIGRLTNHLVVGVLWGAWHLPYMASHWDVTDEPLWTLAPRVILGTTVVAVVYGEIRLRTGSVWPAVIMHASGNAVAGALVATDDVLVQIEPTPWIFSPGVDGLIVTALTTLVAITLWNRRIDR